MNEYLEIDLRTPEATLLRRSGAAWGVVGSSAVLAFEIEAGGLVAGERRLTLPVVS